MRFYNNQHLYYCGIDLQARTMYVCILNREGEVVLHRNRASTPDGFLKAVAAYRSALVVAVECLFTWYGLADLCRKENIPFVLGHALYRKAIQGGKAKNDRIDAHKIAGRRRGGMIPMASVYPPQMRATRDRLRRRRHRMRKRAELLAHVQHTHSQDCLPEIGPKIAYQAHREGIAERFDQASARTSIEVDLLRRDHYAKRLTDLELYSVRTAKEHNADAFYRLRSVPGSGKIWALVLLYAMHALNRCPTVQDVVS